MDHVSAPITTPETDDRMGPLQAASNAPKAASTANTSLNQHDAPILASSAATQAHATPLPLPSSEGHQWRNYIIVGLIVLLLAIGGAAYYLLDTSSSNNQAVVPQLPTEQLAPVAPPPPPPAILPEPVATPSPELPSAQEQPVFAESQARTALEIKAQQEAEAKAKLEAHSRAKREAERIEKAKREAEIKARREHEAAQQRNSTTAHPSVRSSQQSAPQPIAQSRSCSEAHWLSRPVCMVEGPATFWKCAPDGHNWNNSIPGCARNSNSN